MKLNVSVDSVVDLPTGGEWVFIQSAVGDLDITFVTDSGNRTVTIGQGEMLKMPFSGLQFQAKAASQEIEFRLGFGEYTPNITAVTSTIIDQIKKPVAVSAIEGALKVQKINESVTVAEITEPVTVAEITEPVAISAIADPVVIAGIGSVVEVETVTPVEVIDQTGAAFKSTDYEVAAGSFVDVPARDRSQILLQSMGENETRCRVSDVDVLDPSGLWLIGGGSMFGESPILRTKAALRIWNTSDLDAVVTVNEVY